jgi:membrane protease YdiL (CAAX protease family)
MKLILFPDKNPVPQLGITILLTLGSFSIVSLLAELAARYIFGSEIVGMLSTGDYKNPLLTGIFRYYQIVLSVGLFIIPPLILAFIFSGSPLTYLFLNRGAELKKYGIVLFIMVMAIPAINFLIYLNAQIRLPDSLSGLEAYFIRAEKSAEEQTFAFLSTHSLEGLLFNIFMMAMLPAIGEELMFRGILQRVFINITRNTHWGIIISSFIFSAIHFQFYGLFPRWLLGIFFGYMLLWSGSIWLPILAHFINNLMAVIGHYIAASDKIENSPADFGSAPGMLHYAIISLLLVIAGFGMLYRERKKQTYSY